MRNINESMARIESLTNYMQSKREDAVDEGIRDFMNKLKGKFATVVKFFKGIAAKISSKFPYWCPVEETEEGEFLPAVLPATMGTAMKEGYINKNTTVIELHGDAAKMSKYKGNGSTAKKLYPGKNSLEYWRSFVRESENSQRPLKEFDTRPLTMEQIEEEYNQQLIAEDFEYVGGTEEINEAQLKNVDPKSKFGVLDTGRLKEWIKIRLEHPELPCLLIWGAPGIGKTAVLEAVLDEFSSSAGKQYNLIVKLLSSETPENFTLPEYQGTGKDRRKHDIPASWMPLYAPTGDPTIDAQMDEALGKGLLFVDELSRATENVMNIMLALINERRFNEYKLGSGWTIICATNRPEDEESGQSMIGTALKNRFANKYYEPTTESWIEWAKKQNFMSPALLQWLSLPESESMSGGKFFYYDPNTEEDLEDPTAYICTPRSWTNAMKELRYYHHTGTLEGWNIFDIDDAIIEDVLGAYVPSNAIECFMSFLRILQSVGDVKQISEDIWAGSKIPVDLSTIKKAAIPLAQVIVTMHANTLPTDDEFINLAKWIVGLNWGQMATYILDVFMNTFIIDADADNYKRFIFASKTKRQNLPPANTAAINGTLSKTLSKYGISGIADFPDYSQGFAILGKKYAAEIDKFVASV